MPTPPKRQNAANKADVARIIAKLMAFKSIYDEGKLNASMTQEAKNLFLAIEKTDAYIEALSSKDRNFMRAFAPQIKHNTTIKPG